MAKPMSKDQLRKLQQVWYRKIRKADPAWRDIEAKTPGGGSWTMPGGPRTRVVHVSLTGGEHGVGSLATDDNYQWWTNLRHAAHALPASTPARQFLIDVAERGTVGEAKQYGMERGKLRRIWRRFVAKVRNGRR